MSCTRRCLGLFRRHIFAVRAHGRTVARYDFCVRCGAARSLVPGEPPRVIGQFYDVREAA